MKFHHFWPPPAKIHLATSGKNPHGAHVKGKKNLCYRSWA